MVLSNIVFVFLFEGFKVSIKRFKFLLFDRWTCLPYFFYEFQNSAPAVFSTGDHLGLPGLNMDGVPAACVPFTFFIYSMRS